jgi:hypothetical protein
MELRADQLHTVACSTSGTCRLATAASIRRAMLDEELRRLVALVPHEWLQRIRGQLVSIHRGERPPQIVEAIHVTVPRVSWFLWQGGLMPAASGRRANCVNVPGVGSAGHVRLRCFALADWPFPKCHWRPCPRCRLRRAPRHPAVKVTEARNAIPFGGRLWVCCAGNN